MEKKAFIYFEPIFIVKCLVLTTVLFAGFKWHVNYSFNLYIFQ